MLYHQPDETKQLVTSPMAGANVPTVVGITRDKDESDRLQLGSDVVSQHFYQKKLDANLCEFEVESNQAQQDSTSECDESETGPQYPEWSNDSFDLSDIAFLGSQQDSDDASDDFVASFLAEIAEYDAELKQDDLDIYMETY